MVQLLTWIYLTLWTGTNQCPMRKLGNILPKFHPKSRSLLFLKNFGYNYYFMFYSCGFLFRWAAYVAGTILVLMTELGVRFEDSISMLVQYTFFLLWDMLIIV